MMRSGIEILYLTLPVNNADEAVSLSEYLNQHGVCAAAEGNDAVVCPMEDPAFAVTIHGLRQGWLRYWEHSDSGLFGLPVLLKTTTEGCSQCGVGPRVE